MATETEGLVLQADIDNQLALQSLDEMDEAAKKMARDGDASFQKLSTSIKALTTDLRKNQSEYGALGKSFVKAFSKDGTMSAEEFRKNLGKMAADIKKVAAAAKDSSVGIDLSGVIGDLPKIDLDEIIQTGTILARMEEVEQVSTRLLQGIGDEAKQQGAALAASVDALIDMGRPLDEIESEMGALVSKARELNDAFGEGVDTDLSEQLKLSVVERQMETIQSQGGALMQSATASMQKFGQESIARGAELEDLFKRGQISVSDYAKEVSNLGKEVESALEEDIGAELEPIEDSLQLTQAIGKIDTAKEHIDRMGASLRGEVRSGAEDLTNKISSLNDQFQRGAIGPEELNKGLDEVIDTAGEMLDQFKEFDELDIVEALKLTQAEQGMRQVMTVANELAASTSAEAKKAGKDLLKNATVLEEQYVRGSKSAEDYGKEVDKLVTKTNSLSKTFKNIAKADVFKGLNIDATIARVKNLDGAIERLTSSASSEAQTAGRNLEEAAQKFVKMFNRGEIEVKELNSELKKLQSRGNELETTYGTKVKSGLDRATVSVWKMSSALDRMGVRGAGGALRIFDAVKGLNPALIAATAGIVAVGFALKKIGELAIKVGREVAKMFATLIKDSVEVAAKFETVELQLRNIFMGKDDLARQTMNRILELSAELGVDLADRFASTFLPLVDSFEMFERLGKAAATLAVKTGESLDSTSRAFQQAVAGRFRSLVTQFRITADWVEVIKQRQDELGDTAGLVQGLEEYFEATGTGWDTYEGTLRRIRGQLIQTFELFKFELGEPIKIALVDQLTEIGQWVKDNEQDIKNFFRDIGTAIGNLVTEIGEIINTILESIDVEDLDEIANSIDAINLNLKSLLDEMDNMDFNFIIDSLIFILDLINKMISNTKSWIAIFDAAKAATSSTTEDLVRAGSSPLGLPNLALKAGGGLVEDLFSGDDTGISEAQQILDNRAKEKEQIEDQRAQIEADRDARRNAAAGTSVDPDTDKALHANVLLQDRTDIIEETTAAANELNEAFEEFNKETERAFQDIFDEKAKKELDNAIANAQKRIDIEIKHSQALIDIYAKREQDLEDQVIEFARDEEDIWRKHLRRLRDQDLADSKKRQEELEKHLNKLQDIREKFDLDAEEAIRMNDAVALLRIRRREELELRKENRRHERANEKIDEAGVEKRDKLQQQLDDEIEDAEIANRRKLEDLNRSLQQQIDAEQLKHERSLEQQELAEERKRAALQLWEDREVEAFRKMWEEKNADLIRSMDESIATYENGVRELARINAEIGSLMAQGFISATQVPSLPGIPGVNGEFFGIAGNIGGATTAVPGTPGTSYNYGGAVGSGGATAPQPVPQAMRDLAHNLANLRGMDAQIHDAIDQAGYAGLLDIIALIKQVNTSPGRAGGGMVNTGQQYMTGELGPEPIVPMQHGIVAPHNPFMLSPQSQQAGNITTDNSNNVTADISMLDASQLSEVQKTIIRSIFTEELLKIGA